MTGFKLFAACGAALVLLGVPVAASADMAGAHRGAAAVNASEPIFSGRSIHRGRGRRSTGSYTNGRPDGANTGSRKQTPTGGNPGNGDHS